LWYFRDLFIILAWRDVSVRYKQTFLGVAWALVRPILTMVVFVFVFGKIADLPSEGNAPYSILVFSALLPWQFFSTAVTSCSESLIANSNLMTKVYFPRMIVPVATVIAAAIDFILALAVLAFLMIILHWVPPLAIVTIPLWFSLCSMLSIGIGLYLSSLNVRYRDFRYVTPFLVQLGLYVSPVGFASSVVPKQLEFLYSLNPMVGIIEGFRWAIIGDSASLSALSVGTSICISAACIWFGAKRFLKMEHTFSDLI